MSAGEAAVPAESALQQHARWLHAIGAIPIRVASGGKVPLDPGWQHTPHGTSDAAAARFAGHVGNIGATFPASLVALDLDRKNGVDGVATFDQICLGLGVVPPRTLTASTPSGGEHRVYRLPNGVVLSNGVAVAPGVDLRTAGGQIVVEPSKVAGGAYLWDRGCLEVAEMPLALAQHLRRRPARVAAAANDGERRIPNGARNSDLAEMGGNMRRAGFSPEVIEVALKAANEAQCDEPLDDAEVEGIARSVSRYTPAPIAREVFANPAPLPPGAFPVPPDAVAPATAMRAPRVSLADLESRPEPAQRFLIADILPAGVLTLLGAHGGTGKSILALQASVCLAGGLPFMGLQVERCRVVFFSGEDPAPVIRRRLRHVCAHLNVNPRALADWLTVLDATEAPVLYDGSPTAAFETLRADVAELAPGVIVVDNASDAFDSKEIERARVRAFIRMLQGLCKGQDAAVLLLAHVDKATVKVGGSEGYSGSTAWHNSARSRLFLTSEGNVLRLEHQKSNLGRLHEPIHMARTDKGLLTVGQAPGGEDDREAVRALLAEYTARGVNISRAPSARNNPWATLRVDPKFPAGLTKDEFARVINLLFSSGEIYEEQFTTADRKVRARIAVRPQPTGAP